MCLTKCVFACVCVCMWFKEFATFTVYILFDDPPMLHRLLLLLPQVCASQLGELVKDLVCICLWDSSWCVSSIHISHVSHTHGIIVITCFSSCCGTRQVSISYRDFVMPDVSLSTTSMCCHVKQDLSVQMVSASIGTLPMCGIGIGMQQPASGKPLTSMQMSGTSYGKGLVTMSRKFCPWEVQ